MNEGLSAWELVEAIRYSGDAIYFGEPHRGSPLVWARFVSSGVEVSGDTMPLISASLKSVCERLNLDISNVRCFVFPDSSMQANCLSISGGVCGVRLASSLVERLNSRELEFVMGHEIGHFLLGSSNADSTQLEMARRSRAREISCDRVGLIACDNIDVAVRAIMKVASGLSDEYLRFDSASYMRRALDEIGVVSDPANMFATHPPLAVRARALLWFDTFRREIASFRTNKKWSRLRVIDSRVENDIHRYVDHEEHEYQLELQAQLERWIWLAAVVGLGRMSQASQSKLERRFSTTFLEQAKGRLLGADAEDVRSWVEKRTLEAFLAFSANYPVLSRNILNQELRLSEEVLLSPGEKSLLRGFAWFQKMDAPE